MSVLALQNPGKGRGRAKDAREVVERPTFLRLLAVLILQTKIYQDAKSRLSQILVFVDFELQLSLSGSVQTDGTRALLDSFEGLM